MLLNAQLSNGPYRIFCEQPGGALRDSRMKQAGYLSLRKSTSNIRMGIKHFRQLFVS